MQSQTASAPFSWIQATDLMGRLIGAQNHPANIGRDVMAFAGMCDSRDELERHVEACEAAVSRYEAARVEA